MTAYRQELRRWLLVLTLQAVKKARGNQTVAAMALGVHRNTVQRAVREAGYTMESLKLLAAPRRKPVASETAAGAARRIA